MRHDAGEIAFRRGGQQVGADQDVLLAQDEDRVVPVPLDRPVQSGLRCRRRARVVRISQQETAQHGEPAAASLEHADIGSLEYQHDAEAARLLLAPAMRQQRTKFSEPPVEKATPRVRRRRPGQRHHDASPRARSTGVQLSTVKGGPSEPPAACAITALAAAS